MKTEGDVLQISNVSRILCGVILITVPTIEYGGTFLLGAFRKRQPYMENPLRQSLFRAGHAHAGVLVILSLVCQILVDAIILPAPLEWFARLGAPIAAILVPAGFFFSVIPPKAERPNGFISLTYVGAAVLAIGVLILVRITPHKIRLTLEICSTSPSVFKRAYRQPGIRPQSHIPITTYQDVGEVVREVAHVQRQVHG